MAGDTVGEHPASFSLLSISSLFCLSPFPTPSLSLLLSLHSRAVSLFVPLRHFGLKVKREFGRFSGTFLKRERERKEHTEVVTNADRMDEGNIPRGVRVPL